MVQVRVMISFCGQVTVVLLASAKTTVIIPSHTSDAVKVAAAGIPSQSTVKLDGKFTSLKTGAVLSSIVMIC